VVGLEVDARCLCAAVEGGTPPPACSSTNHNNFIERWLQAAPSEVSQVADVGFISLRELIVLRSDVTAARMRSRSVGRGIDRSASARAVAAA
jgi:hypothetical protein